MAASTRKVLQDEINSLDGKNEMESSRKVQFLQ
jgi:ATP-dependent Lon protease